MLGTIINTIAIIVGSLIGLLLKGGISKRFEDIIMKALGLSVLFIGIQGSLKSTDTLLLIISIVVGAIVGEAIDIDKWLNSLGEKIEEKFKIKGKGGNIAEGFVSASLLFCVGSMAIVGAIQSGLEGNHTTLYVKSMLDGITSIIYTSSMGIGVIFAAVAVFVYQGLITVAASFLGGVLLETQIASIGGIGSILIIGLGLNMLKITSIKVGNLLPSLFIPILYYIVMGLV